jgi:hypothetical protein
VDSGHGYYRAAERRIGLCTIVIGAFASAVVWEKLGMKPGLAVGAGTVLSWLNFRLLSQVTGTMAALIDHPAVQNGTNAAQRQDQAVQTRTKSRRRAYVKLFALLALLLLAAYVILAVLRLPALPLLGGMLAVVPAIVAELIWELMSGSGVSAKN